MGGQQSAPVEVRPRGGEILHGNVVVGGVGSEQKNGVGTGMLEAIEGIFAGFDEVEVEKQAAELAKANGAGFHGSISRVSKGRVAQLTEPTDRICIQDICQRDAHGKCSRRPARPSSRLFT